MWRTTSGELIPEDNAIVLIEHLWIRTNVDLSNKRILEDIGEIPDDADDDYIDDENVNTDGKSRIEGKDIMNYDIDDLVNKYRLES
ncbi:unnamed protein product [Rhizophagus irregularis]|nr:unnamed protein product [Rhizophagus irregularis]